MKRCILLLAVLAILAIMPAAQARQTIDYRGTVGDAGTIKLTVVKRDSGRRFIVAEKVVGISASCEGGGEFGGGVIAHGLNVRLRDDRPFVIDIPILGGNGGLFHTEGQIGWRVGDGVFVYTTENSDGDACTTGDLPWTVERVTRRAAAS